MIEAAHRGDLDVLYSVGGNFLRALPEPNYVREALERIPLRVHQDILLNDQMLIDSGEATLLLPAQTRTSRMEGARKPLRSAGSRSLRISPGRSLKREASGAFSETSQLLHGRSDLTCSGVIQGSRSGRKSRM